MPRQIAVHGGLEAIRALRRDRRFESARSHSRKALGSKSGRSVGFDRRPPPLCHIGVARNRAGPRPEALAGAYSPGRSGPEQATRERSQRRRGPRPLLGHRGTSDQSSPRPTSIGTSDKPRCREEPKATGDGLARGCRAALELSRPGSWLARRLPAEGSSNRR